MILGQAKRLYELRELSKFERCGGIDPPVISFLSGKGGTGKSFISVNLAHKLSNSGKKILLIDLDTNLANINVMLNSYHEKSLADYLEYDSTLEEIIHPVSNSFHVIMGESGRLDHPEVNTNNLGRLIRELKSLSNRYDYILIDTSSGIGEQHFTILNLSDILILVTTPEPTSVMDAYVVLKMIESRYIKIQKNLIINKVNSTESGKTTFENLKKISLHFLNNSFDLLGILSNEQAVSLAIESQKLISDIFPESIINHELTKLCENFLKNVQMVNNGHNKERASREVF